MLIVVLRLDRQHDFDSVATLHCSSIIQRNSFTDKSLQQRRMIHELEILAPHEDLIPCRLQRLFQTEELRSGRKVKWPTAILPHDADLIRPVVKQFARNVELAGRAESVIRRDLFSGDRSSIYRQLVSNHRLDLATDAQVVVERQD